ncbi:TPA: tyrosine-type recombinase/integrase [Stenotrophomonas maltophilia]|nr:tyrosine-type recombinase/integrase [Stenotrophomonas maltophilia]
MSKNRYLQRLGHSWYVRIKVPTALRGIVKGTHIRRALNTRDLDDANRRKWAVISQVHEHFQAQASNPNLGLALVISPSRAIEQDAAPSPAQVNSQNLRPSAGLDALSEEWAATSNLKTVRFQRQQAYKELRCYLGNNRSPTAVTGALAASYVDECLLESKDSPSTRRRKLSALAAFWEWMSSRCYLPKGTNPWKGFRIRAEDSSNTPKKRPYTMQELVQLFSGEPGYPALREVMVLGLYTGARIDEICSIKRGDVRVEDGFVYIHICKSKTAAGTRTLAIWHPIAKGLLMRRLKQKEAKAAQLFPELKGGGYDNKLSWRVGQAFRYHRNGRGLTEATDFHSLRRTFITRLENLGVDQVRIARYVGHSLPTLAFQLYSGGATEATQAATGQMIAYPKEVEQAITAFIDCLG